MCKIFRLFVLLFLTSMFLVGCRFDDKYMVTETSEVVFKTCEPLIFEDGIVLPPDFSHNDKRITWNYFFGDNDFLSACRFSKGIVRATIGNYVGEQKYGDEFGVSIFEAQVLECYKGNLKGKISIAWEAFSGGAHSDVELPFYGDEIVLFLEKEEHNDFYGIYCIFFEFDVVSIDDDLYVVSENMDVIYQLGFLLPKYSLIEYPSLVEPVSELFNEKINYWEQKSNRDYPEFSAQRIENIFSLEDFIELIEYVVK